MKFAVIIGVFKAGTSSLYYYLSEHPVIAPCVIKEPNFFCMSNKFSRGIDSYKNLWEWDSKIHKYALEASHNYT